MGFIEKIMKLIPENRSEEIDWNKIEPLFVAAGFSGLKEIQQNPVFHGEGDVFSHTKMVCRNLTMDPGFHELLPAQKTELFIAAILHDIGKVWTTRKEDGNWVSPHHASVGSQIVRTFLWRDCGLCGTHEFLVFRESVCAMIRWHMLPVHLIDKGGLDRKMREVAAVGELAEDFSWNLLCMLAEADIKGRIADDVDHNLERVHLSRMLAEEAGCLLGPYSFKDSFTKHAYLSGRNVLPNQTLYDNTWGEVILLSGLPGTGKDTWIRQNYPDIPMVSLDEIRDELNIRSVDNQGQVIQTAREIAKEYLRNKQIFIWNATDMLKDTRQNLIGLFERYNARVKIVYLETDWSCRIERNRKRKNAVPEVSVVKMLDKTVLPTPDEAQSVEWVCV